MAAENRVSRLEECDCKRTCTFNGKEYVEGDIWEDNCDICNCKDGKTTCSLNCAEVNCPFPVRNATECCPRCLSECFSFQFILEKFLINVYFIDDCLFYANTYRHGQMITTHNCLNCSCNDGNMACVNLNCPVLSCPVSKQKKDGCCMFCEGEQFGDSDF